MKKTGEKGRIGKGWKKDLETAMDFIFLGFKITADSDCSHEIKMLACGKEIYDKPRQC